jgi:hypothetical protein
MLGYWDVLIGALRALVVVLSTAFLAILRRVLTLPEIWTVYVFVADVTLFTALWKTVARQWIEGVVLLAKYALPVPHECVLAELTLVTDIAAALTKTIHVSGVTAWDNFAISLIILVAVHVTGGSVRLSA